MRLGKLPARVDERVPRLAVHAVGGALPPAPASVDWTNRLSPCGVLGNDAVGDCTIAAAGHLTQLWSGIVPDDAAMLAVYSRWTGYKPGDPSTDCGAEEMSVLDHWLTEGLAMNGEAALREIHGFARVNWMDLAETRSACFAFGGLYVGALLPAAAQTQDLWDAPRGTLAGPDRPGSWGGHAMAVVGYNEIGPVFCTWGTFKQATWAWWMTYIDEAYVVLSRDWPTTTVWDAMVAQVQALKGALRMA